MPRARSSRTARLHGKCRLISGEAVEQPVAAGAAQIGLAAAALRTARGMRGIPRMRGRVVAQSDAVVMAEHRRALRAARPVATGAVVAGREGGAVRLRAGQDVVPVRRVAASVDDLSLLVKRGLLR